MMYLSKGAPACGGTFRVSQCGKVYELGPEMAGLWRRGRLKPMPVMPDQARAVKRLADAGLAAVSDEEGNLGAFQLLKSCILCPSYQQRIRLPLQSRERRIWKWVREAGLRLTASELIRLEEQGVEPVPELLGESGRQALTERIYLSTNIFDGILDSEMEHSPAREATVSAVLKLLRTHRLLAL